VYLGLGTNLGDRRAQLAGALERLGGVVEIDAISRVYESEPVGYREQPVFWNLVLRGGTDLEPEPLLEATQAIERELGRRRSFRNAPRPIDIDMLLFDDEVRVDGTLQLPHPRMLERGFVLRPLAELDPELRHPVTGRTIREELTLARGLERCEPLFAGSELLSSEGG